MEGEEARYTLEELSHALWVRLQYWKYREANDKRGLECLFDRAQSPLESVDELHYRKVMLNVAVELDELFVVRLKRENERVEEALNLWLKGLSGAWPEPPEWTVVGKPPAKDAVGAASDSDVSGPKAPPAA